MALFEYSMSVNDFLEPDIQAGPQAVCRLLIQLLLLEPNTYDTHPDMGVGLTSRFRYSFKGHADELQREFQNQITKYLPGLSGTNVSVKEIQNMYYITAQFEKSVYLISVNEELKVNGEYRTLTDIIGG